LGKEDVNMNINVRPPKIATKAKRKVLFFKAIDYSAPTLVFAPPPMAEGHDKVMKALAASKTWGEFRASIPGSAFKEIKQLLRECEEYTDAEIRELIADDSPFDSATIPGFADGEYPSMIASIQQSILPIDVAKKYGKQWGAFNCSDVFRIDVGHREAILTDLKALGYEVIERSDLDFF
jgi:hypothetical protein